MYIVCVNTIVYLLSFSSHCVPWHSLTLFCVTTMHGFSLLYPLPLWYHSLLQCLSTTYIGGHMVYKYLKHPNPGTKPTSPSLAGRFFSTEPLGMASQDDFGFSLTDKVSVLMFHHWSSDQNLPQFSKRLHPFWSREKFLYHYSLGETVFPCLIPLDTCPFQSLSPLFHLQVPSLHRQCMSVYISLSSTSRSCDLLLLQGLKWRRPYSPYNGRLKDSAGDRQAFWNIKNEWKSS